MLHQLNIFLLMFGALQGFLLSIVLFRNRRKHRAGLYLTFFLTLVGLQLTFKVISKMWLSENVSGLYNISYFLPFLAGPLLYLFIRSYVTGSVFRFKDLLHALPLVAGALYVVGVATYGYLYTTPIDRSILMAYPRGVLQIASLLLYTWFSLKILAGHANDVARRALLQFVIVVAVSEALIVIAIAVLQQYWGAMPDIRLVFVVLTAMIYWISYKVISQPEVFRPAGALLVKLNTVNQAKYAHSGLKSEEADRIAELLRSAMSQQKLYLNADLSIDSLATTLNVSRHHISQVLNDKFQQSYYDYVSGYRLEEASLRLTGQKYRHYTIAAIAHDSGFSSVSNFNEVFKKRYGVTPSRFRDQHAGKMSA
jgi:AraC-like DNA-binding protein